MSELQKQIQQMAEAAKHWNEVIEPIRAEVARCAERADHFFQPIQDDFVRSAHEAAQVVDHETQQHAKQIAAWYAQSRAAAEVFSSQMQDLRVPEWLGQVIRELPERTRQDLRALASRGWYLDPEIAATAPSDLREAIDRGEFQVVDDALAEWFRGRVEGILEVVTARHPDRAGVLRKAIEAHIRGDYELSVPVLLIQADGICWDRTKLSLFMTRDKSPQVANYLKTYAADGYRQSLLAPLMELHPIAFSHKERSVDFDGLNRHQVLHGESTSYASEVNSLKAISLLNYLSWVLFHDPISD